MTVDSIRAPESATKFTNRDESICLAWERFAAARAILSVLDDPCPPGKFTSPAQDAQDKIIEDAEALIGDTVAASARGVEIKLWLMLHDHADNEPSAMQAVREDLRWCAEQGAYNGFDRLIIPAIRSLRAMQERPTQDAFAVKLTRYHEAMTRRAEYEAAHTPAIVTGLTPEWEAFEAAMFPLHITVFEAGRAVLLEPAPDLAALVAKRAVFDALEFWAIGDEPEVFTRLFDDAIALAGGAA